MECQPHNDLHTEECIKGTATCDPPCKLSVNDSKEKPFTCSHCGESYEPCFHWQKARAVYH